MEDKRIVYFDIETQKSADEVGGWDNKHLMKMAVGIVYDSLDGKFYTYLEGDAEGLVKKLLSADLVVGFNILNFDFAVLQPYTIIDLKSNIRYFDILKDVYSRLGYRVSLNQIAKRTLHIEKSGNGLLSLQWFKEGKLDKIIEYCIKDVEITRDVFLFGLKNRYLEFEKNSQSIRLTVNWNLEEMLEKKQNNHTKTQSLKEQ
ncbi:MAG: ribonuclease H-like domain-containing protein [Nitrospinae bacterium]|nr:ribonuclease H-like domain-containing protein [Nitrospinota bacterium]